jgi:hypothetical protein
MRNIGKRHESLPALNPSADALRRARIHQRTAESLAAVSTTGIRKGVYRFATHEEMNRHADEGLALAIASNVLRREAQGKQRR